MHNAANNTRATNRTADTPDFNTNTCNQDRQVQWCQDP